MIALHTLSSAPLATFLLTFCIVYVIVLPLWHYYKDAKGLRKYSAFAPLAGVTNLPFIFESHKGFRSMTLSKLHQKESVLRTGPNSLSFSDPRAIKDIYGHNTPCKKDGQYSVTAGSHFHLADVIDRHEHARKRKVLSAAYALRNLEGWEFKVADKCQRLINQFDKRSTAPLEKGKTSPQAADLTVDYRAWTNFFTLDAIADIGLSERLGFLDQGNDKVTARRGDGFQWETNYRESLYNTARKQALLVWSYTWYPVVNQLSNIIPFYRRMSMHAYNWDGIVLERAAKRLARYNAGEELADFFQALMEDPNGTPNDLDWGEIVAEVSIMMNAGSATTAIAMANTLCLLLQHPKCLARVREEVDVALDPEDVVAPYDKVRHLPYLRACIDEALRLWPPTCHGLPRETPPEGMSIAGEYIAGNVTVSMPAMVAHRLESIYDKADQYIPERWLGEKGRELQPYFISFSAGARGCIGRNISYLEQSVVLASVLHRYEFALPHPEWDIERLETFNLLLGPMPIKIWLREQRQYGTDKPN